MKYFTRGYSSQEHPPVNDYKKDQWQLKADIGITLKMAQLDGNHESLNLYTLAHGPHIGLNLGPMLGMVFKKYISLNNSHTSLETIGKTTFLGRKLCFKF